MNFNKLVKDSKEGLKRSIFSRREKLIVSIDEFNLLSKKYFNHITKDENLIVEFDNNDKEPLVFIFRWYYNLWIDINNHFIEVYHSFPKQFEIISEVNKLNHPHTPKTFKKGTKMYFNHSSYSSCNWMRGIPLWDDKYDEVGDGLKPSCQINYNFIKLTL